MDLLELRFEAILFLSARLSSFRTAIIDEPDLRCVEKPFTLELSSARKADFEKLSKVLQRIRQADIRILDRTGQVWEGEGAIDRLQENGEAWRNEEDERLERQIQVDG